MMDYRKHLIISTDNVKSALSKLEALAPDSILFVVNERDQLLGSMTDGDIRRGLLKGLNMDSAILSFVQPHPVFIKKGSYTLRELQQYRQRNLKIIPILNDEDRIIDVLNLRLQTTMLPVDALIMAGGKGKRLLPLTENCPKPMLKVGDKPIIEYNIDRLIQHGVQTIHISINYLGHIIENHFGDGSAKGTSINYLKETAPMGTIGSARLLGPYDKEALLVMNSDLLTNIDFIDFYNCFADSNADMAVAAIGYHVDIPYAVFEMNGDNTVKSLMEKPRYTYYSNAGIYIIKKELLQQIPAGEPFDIPDLMNKVLTSGGKLVSYPILGYWLDIGRMTDFAKAQEDIKHINF
ncbi:nucleotidyltransferase family protein [Chitinophaga caseinilytica]|uniref:nucleotidyltransferase family protein n=1 Tax=Chitinophaga caseinilytica TaxID=2267521 RepID=UPI003C2DA7E2